jgi:hypothetical protein
MRIVRKVGLLALLGIAVAAATAPMASAQTIEVFDEDTGLHCPGIFVNGHQISGGCSVGVSSDSPVELRRHLFGSESHIADCDWRFVMTLNEDGAFYFTDVQITNCIGDADVTACDEGDAHGNGDTPMPGSGSESATVGIVNATSTMCLETGVFGIRCEGPTAFPINTSSEQYRITLNDTRIGSSVCEVDANFTFDPNSIHINHL